METIKVNMTPNPLDVQTIHASQNDGEARQWGFELHNNGDAIDSSSISDQLVFKAYKGGTEEILPTNGSTPTTSPFLGDIRYPQGLLSDQEFLYRESPTEEDGNAKITDIKGNTLVWNQLVHGEFGSNYTHYWSVYSGTGSISNGELTVTDAIGRGGVRVESSSILPLVTNHKYFISLQYKSTVNLETHFVIAGIELPLSSSYKTYSSIETHTGVEVTKCIDLFPTTKGETGTFSIKNVMCLDLTQMFGSGNEPTTVEEFTSLFPLPYYDYNQGTLIPFSGNGIKTVGFNQWDEDWEVGAVNSATGENESASDRIRSKNYIKCLPNTEYFYVAGGANLRIIFYDANKAYISYFNYSAVLHSFTTPSNCCYMRFNSNAAYGTTYNNDICINISSNRNGEYEPYTSSALSLPISTYFPNGMKSAGSVYDELTPTKAITRIGAVDLGTLYWRAYTDVTTRKIYYAERIGMDSTSAQLTCAELTAVPWGSLPNMAEKTIQAHPSLSILYACDSSCEDATEFTSAMNGVYLYYELATPTETSFTTASLVTENAEIPLSNNDGVLLGKCTEQLSENPGFIDAKIKLSDEDGECYSNKIQLHVERSPQ